MHTPLHPRMPRTVSRRQSTQITHPRRRRARSLDLLPDLPLDIISEIFCFLHPADLLVLARTTKTLRAFLLDRSSAFVWRSARRNIVGLPEPPPGSTELQYASLVFGPACHYDGCARKARDTVWHLRIRSCVGCRTKHQSTKLNESCDYIALCRMLNCCASSLEQYIPCGPFLNSKGNSAKGFQEHHIRLFKEELAALPLSDRQAYLDRRIHDTELISQFARAGVAWQMAAKNLRIAELRNKRAARAEIIKENLVSTGFGDEIDYFGWDRIRKHPLISNTHPLTENALSHVVDQLREYMLGWQELRMEEQVFTPRRQIFVDAWFQFTTAAFYNAPDGCPYLPLPPISTIGLIESIDSVIRQPGHTLHESLQEQFYTAFLPACDYILEWHRTTRRELASLLPDYNPEDDDEAISAQLRFATSVFQCNSGRNCRSEGHTLTYPEILFHPCFTSMTTGNGPSTKDPRNIASQKACLAMGGSPWNCSGRVQVHPKLYAVNKVLSCCEKDPRSTTATEMDEQDPRLVCLECAVHHRIISCMSWRRAIQHNISSHSTSTVNRPWLMASQFSRLRIAMLELQSWRPYPNVSGYALDDYSICLLCPPRIPSWNTRFGFGDLMDHITKKHGVAHPEFKTDYTFDTKITPVYLDPLTFRLI